MYFAHRYIPLSSMYASVAYTIAFNVDVHRHKHNKKDTFTQ